MSDKIVCVYSLRGWQERAHIHHGTDSRPFPERWRAAGALAATVLGWPTQRPSFEPWHSRITNKETWSRLKALVLKEGSDEERLRAVLGLKGPLSKVERDWLASARGFAEFSAVEEVAMQARLRQAAKLRRRAGLPRQHATRNWLLLHPGAIEGYALGMDEERQEGTRRRDEHHLYTNPGAAVYLSAATGLARETLRLCEECARFVAFDRVGFSQKYCDKCQKLRSTRRQRDSALRVSRGTSRTSRAKAERWQRVSNRIYRRMLREDHSTNGDGRMTPEAREKWESWCLFARNTLRDAKDLDAWERRASAQAWAEALVR